MKVQILVRSIAILLFGMLASLPARALVIDTGCAGVTGLCVTISTVNADGTAFSVSLTPQSGATINLDSDTGGPNGGPGGAVNYGVFSISRCAGCAGRARIFVVEGSIDKLVLTDATFTNTNTGATLPPQTLTISVDSGLLSVSGPSGQYPYATELTGTFSAPFLTGSTLDGIDKITVTATTNGNCDGPCMIDSPQLDAGETNPNQYSLVAPPFLTAAVASYAPKEMQNIQCGFFNGDTDTPCQPDLALAINVSLKSRHSAKVQGSVGVFHVTSPCEPDSADPARIKGCQIMADFFASLGPKGFKVYDVRLEPSPGTKLVEFRFDAFNSSDVWVSRRGGDDDHDSDDGNISKTRARLLSNGSGEVHASGLCPASGCPASNVLPVRMYCGGDNVTTTALPLDKHGDGKATVSFGLPCVDPAVLIMDPNNGSTWVAAPAIL